MEEAQDRVSSAVAKSRIPDIAILVLAILVLPMVILLSFCRPAMSPGFFSGQISFFGHQTITSQALARGRDDAGRDADASVEHGALPVRRLRPEGHEVLDRLVGVGKGITAGDFPDEAENLPHSPGESRGYPQCLREAALPDPVDNVEKPGRETVGRAQQEAVVGPSGRAEPPGVIPFGAPHEEYPARVDTGLGDAVRAARVLEEDEIRVFGDEPREGLRRRFIPGDL